MAPFVIWDVDMRRWKFHSRCLITFLSWPFPANFLIYICINLDFWYVIIVKANVGKCRHFILMTNYIWYLLLNYLLFLFAFLLSFSQVKGEKKNFVFALWLFYTQKKLHAVLSVCYWISFHSLCIIGSFMWILLTPLCR